MYKIVVQGQLYIMHLTLEEAKSIVERWELRDKVDGIYTPNLYKIKLMKGNE